TPPPTAMHTPPLGPAPPPTPAAWVHRERPRSMRPIVFGAVGLIVLFIVPSVLLYLAKHGRPEKHDAGIATVATSAPPPPETVPEPLPSVPHTDDTAPPPATSSAAIVPTAPPSVAPRPSHGRAPEQTPDAGRIAPRPSARPNDDDIPTMR